MHKSMPAINYGQLLPYTESLANIVTIHEPQFNTPVWLEMPRADAKDLTIYQIKELGLNPTEIDIQSVTRDGIRPWIAIEASVLDMTHGFHMIQFTFTNTVLNVYQSYYFSYMAQIDDPAKPYIYMERTDNT